MDTEETRDVKSLCDIFQSGIQSHTLPAYTKEREELISNVRSNPAFQRVINALEDQVKSVTNPPKKPDVAAKPNGLSKDMKLSKGFSKNYNVTDPTRTTGGGNGPQKYRHSMPNLQEPPPMMDQFQPQVYEDVEQLLIQTAPINNAKTAGSKHPPLPIGPKPVKMQMTRSLLPDALKENVNEGPSERTLRSLASLGPPPPKPLRPPNVDLSTFLTLQQNGPEESAGGEYETPALSPNPPEEVYDEALSPKSAAESDYTIEDEYDFPDAGNPESDDQSQNETDDMSCYQDVVHFREPTNNSVYDTDPVSSSDAPQDNPYEVESNNEDVSYSSTMNPSGHSPASEGYYSGDFDASGDSSRPKDSKSKQVKLGKNEQALRKKLKISGQEKMIYTSTIIGDFKAEKLSQPMKKGDVVEVVRITGCPAGKWLVRDVHGNHGLVPLASLQVSSEIQSFSTRNTFHTSVEEDLYTDIEVQTKSGGNTDTLKSMERSSVKLEEQYDDISNMSQALNNSGGKGKGFGNFFKKDKPKKEDSTYSPVMPSMNRTSSQEGEEYHTYALSDEQNREKEEKSPGWRLFNKKPEQKGSEKKFFPSKLGVNNYAKEENKFREKFKYTGEIKILNIATINDLAPLSTQSKQELAVKPGETVEVIDVTSEDQIICRNFAGKYGYVRIDCLDFHTENSN